MSAGPRVVVAGGSPLVRSVLVQALRGASVAVEPAVDWPALRAACAGSTVDVVVAPTQLGDRPLREVLGELLTHGVRVLVVCDPASTRLVPDLLLSGASGFLSTADCTADQLVDAVRSVADGQAALHAAVAEAVLRQWRELRAEAVPAPEVALTAQEQRVLAEMVAGGATKTIARTLGVSPKTVESHRSRLYAKLGARSQAQAVQIALERGLVAGRA